MKTGEMTGQDVETVFNNLWPQGREEILIMGSTVEKERKIFRDMVGKPWSTSFYSDNGECIAVFIMIPTGEMKWRTHFAAVEEGFEKYWFSITKFFRRASDKIVYDITEGKGIIELFTMCENDMNWFEVIGFDLVGTDGFIDQYEKKVR